jgi:TetR/AcrR family transcriptional regulator
MLKPSIDTRVAILQAAEIVFACDGLRAARTEDIAERVGVTKAMIHYYFGTKEKLYEEVLARVDRERAEGIDFASLGSLPPRIALRQFVERLLDQVSADPHTVQLFALENIQNNAHYLGRMSTTLAALIAIIERGIVSGDFRPIDARHAAVNVMGVCVHYFNVLENVRSLWPGRGASDARRAAEHKAAALDFIAAAIHSRSRRALGAAR